MTEAVLHMTVTVDGVLCGTGTSSCLARDCGCSRIPTQICNSKGNFFLDCDFVARFFDGTVTQDYLWNRSIT